MLAATRTGSNRITNVLTGATYLLPDMSIDMRGELDFYMFMHVAALSSPPDEPGCVGAAIIQYMSDLRAPRRIALFSVAAGAENAIDPLPEEYNEHPEDVIHFKGSFHVLTREEQVRACRPVFSNNGNVQFEWHHYQFPDGRLYDHHVHGRYLVESRGELLMVIKLSPVYFWESGWTSGFRMFQMIRLENIVPLADTTHCAWEELPDLDGRMLFIGRGCSRCYEVKSFPDFQDGVYFAEDRSFYDAYRIVHNLPFPCLDNGRYQGIPHNPHIDQCFPTNIATSDYSSPVWVLP